MCVFVVIPSILNASLHLSVYSLWAHQPGSHRRKANTVDFFFWGGGRHISEHYCVLYYNRCVACVCLCVVVVCVQAGVCLRACVSVCALLLNLCYICMADAMCARVCV